MSGLGVSEAERGDRLGNIALCLSCPLPDCENCLAPGGVGSPKRVVRNQRSKYGAFAAKLVAQGISGTAEIAAALEVSERTVRRWVSAE